MSVKTYNGLLSMLANTYRYIVPTHTHTQAKKDVQELENVRFFYCSKRPDNQT